MAMNASVTYPSSSNQGTAQGTVAEQAVLSAKTPRSISQW
jgi:uncharacterized alpha-E superfamily protein